ncbi:MAG: nodulation protein NfeD, partial [Bdellovibrionales bacterium]|nr:nodulation protein NfeD [Bdellovibrionales bacterium]
EWGGVMLLVLGLGLLIAEAFVPSFGALGLGGITAFVIGSLFLFDPEKTGYQLPLGLILATAGAIGSIMMGLAFLAFKTFRLRTKWGGDEMKDRSAQVVSVFKNGTEGQVEVLGEVWKFNSKTPVTIGENVWIEQREGLTLFVKPQREK